MSSWFQQQLTASEVYELNIRLGVIPSTDHAQGLVELKDPLTGILIGQWAAPHTKWDNWPRMLDMCCAKALVLVGQALEPF